MAKIEYRVLLMSDDSYNGVKAELQKAGFGKVEDSHSVSCDFKIIADESSEKIARTKAQEFYDTHKKDVLEILVLEH